MQNSSRMLALKTLQIFDLILMTSCFFLATFATYQDIGPAPFGSFFDMRVRILNFAIFAFFLFLWRGVFALCGLYRSRRLTSLRRDTVDMLKATSGCSLVLAVFGPIFRVTLITPGFIAWFWGASTVSMITGRLVLRAALEALRRRRHRSRRLLMVGTNRRAVEYARKVESKPELGYQIIGFVEDRWSDNHEFRQNGYSVVANFENFPEFIRTQVVDEVMVCLPMKSHYNIFSEIVRICEEQGIIVRFLSDFFNLELGRSIADTLDGEPIITIYTGAMQGWPLLFKRGADAVLSVVLLLALAPLMIAAALAIKLTSPGPVLFVQERVGLNKRTFPLYKFRTMAVGAEKMIKDLEALNEASGPVFKIKNDPRITPIGKVLRKTSIDELPQLLNVVMGHMSLVGPRPLPLRDYEGFDEDWQRRRFTVRPGITCLWQVGGRSNLSFEQWMELDMRYIDQWSLGLDLRILMQTIPAVLKGAGAE